MTRDEMLRRMSASELQFWSMYERQTGLLDQTARSEVASAIVAKTVADVQRAKKQKPYPIDTFMAYPIAPDPDPDDDEDDVADDTGGDSDVPSADDAGWATGWAPA